MTAELRSALLQLMDRYGIGEFVYSGPDGALRISDDDPADLHPAVLAASAGLFYAQHPAQSAAAQWPRSVQAGDIIAYLKVGPLLKPVLARQNGLLRKPLLADGSLAGYQQRLF